MQPALLAKMRQGQSPGENKRKKTGGEVPQDLAPCGVVSGDL